jgi:hypothetical protein
MHPYRKAMAKAVAISVLISCLFGALVIPVDHFIPSPWSIAGVWGLKLFLGIVTVFVGAEACRECLARKHGSLEEN